MKRGTGLICAAAALLAGAPHAAAQAAPAGGQATMSSVSRGAGRAAYTGLGVGGLPAPAADGSPRWADYPVVRAVAPASPAARVGILPGDVVLLVNGADARDPRTLFGEPGKVFNLRVRRGDTVREFVVPSIRRPGPDPRE